MTSKRRKLTIAALFCIGVVVVIAFLNHENEPRHKGKTLSQWLGVYAHHAENGNGEEAMVAVRAIGTNALPYLLRWIEYEEPAWRDFLADAPPAKISDNRLFRSFIVGQAGRRAEYACAGFQILGTNAASVVPELEFLSKSTNAPDTVLRAFSALVCIGEPSLPVLERAMADKNQTLRSQIPYWLRYMARKDGPAAYLPLLHQALTNEDRTMRTNAAAMLESIRMSSK